MLLIVMILLHIPKKFMMSYYDDYFVNIGPKLVSNLHSSTSYDNYLQNPTSSLFFLRPTSHDEIHGILNNLRDSSNGHGNSDVIFVKYVSNIISNPLPMLYIIVCHLVLCKLT